MEKDELVERSSPALFYGETMVMSTWGSGLGTGIGEGIIGGGFATSTASKVETQQGQGTLFLTNKRLVFVADTKKVKFSVPLQALQSVNYQEKLLGMAKCIGLSFAAGNAIQTATFCIIGIVHSSDRKISAESWVQNLTISVRRIQEGTQVPDQLTTSQADMIFCGECGKQIHQEAKFCKFCGGKTD